MGDPFVTVETARTSFTIGHYGGSAWRWADSFTFSFLRRDDTWQLVRVTEESFHAADPEERNADVAPSRHQLDTSVAGAESPSGHS